MRHVTTLLLLTATGWLVACQATPLAIPVEDRVPTPVQALRPPPAASTGAPLASAGLSRPPPEAATGSQSKPGWATRRFAVAAANPLATQAGYRVLKDGGSAVDAAIAVQMVLTLVEPQSSGIGGGAFLLHHDPALPAPRRTEAYDGRETAPAAATERLFLKDDGQPMAFMDAVVGGRSVGTPGVVAMLALAHREHGRLPWARLFEPAVALARDGFPVSPRLHALLLADPHLRQDATAAAYFYAPDGSPWPVGHVLKNPELAAVLQALARQGPRALQRGPVASRIVHTVRNHARNPGVLSEADLARYTPLKRAPLCTDHAPTSERSVRLCGMPPPSSGAVAVAQILGLLQHTPAATLPLDRGLPSADWLHLYTEAARLAFADRNQYLADPDFVPAPGGNFQSLLAPGYLAERARLIGPQSMKTASAGMPGPLPQRVSAMPAQPESGTSHISIVDAQGRAVAMTTTIESAFGARLMVNRGQGLAGGFLLNNELTDFSFAPAGADGLPVANRVQSGKRPRSSMSPTLVFERLPDGSTGPLLATLGSPGGAAIIHYTAKTLIGLLHWGLDAQRAIDLPNFGSNNGPTLLEAGRFPADTVRALQARGHTVNEVDLTSGLQAIQKRPHGYFGGADPRREGLVMGD